MYELGFYREKETSAINVSEGFSEAAIVHKNYNREQLINLIFPVHGVLILTRKSKQKNKRKKDRKKKPEISQQNV